MNEKYTEEQWAEDVNLNEFCGLHKNWFSSGCTIPCPNCKTVGFYGPKQDPEENPTRKYRACKFCGFWQEAWGNYIDKIGEAPYRCIAVRCEKCQVYDWRAPLDFYLGSCPNCKEQMTKIEWASDDPNHAFHKKKEEMDAIHATLNKN